MSLVTIPRESPGVLVTPGGIPVPPQSVVQRIAAISDRLSVEWIAGAWRPYWGLKIRWAMGDPRYEWVRNGRIPASAAFDLEQMFPEDCTTEDMVAYIEQRWGDRGRATNAAQVAEQMVSDTAKQHADVREQHTRAIVTTGQERYLSESDHLRRVRAGAERAHPMISGGL